MVAHPPILEVGLLPPDIPTFCSSCAAEKHMRGATHWAVSPEGNAITKLCGHHGRELCAHMPTWSLHLIHHVTPHDRTTHARPPVCPHSDCRQHFIDTGANKCLRD